MSRLVDEHLANRYYDYAFAFLEQLTFPQLLDELEAAIVEEHELAPSKQEELHELLHSPEFEEAFTAGWSDEADELFADYEGTDEDFIEEHSDWMSWKGMP
jgi:hypothetical protein